METNTSSVLLDYLFAHQSLLFTIVRNASLDMFWVKPMELLSNWKCNFVQYLSWAALYVVGF